MKIKRRILITFVLTLFTVPCIMLIMGVSRASSCTQCYYGNTNYTPGSSYGGTYSCGYDGALIGTYRNQNTNNARTTISACTNQTSYKDVYVYMRSSDNQTASDWDNSTWRINMTAEVDTSFTPIRINHEIITTMDGDEYMHARYFY